MNELDIVGYNYLIFTIMKNPRIKLKISINLPKIIQSYDFIYIHQIYVIISVQLFHNINL